MKSLILSDIHANPAALEAVLEFERDWDEVVFLGDAVIGGPQPDEVLSILRTLPGIFVMGNHDRELLNLDMTASHTNPDRLYQQWNRSQVSAENLAFLASFVQPCTIERDGLTLRLMHDYREMYVWPDSPDETFLQLGDAYSESVLLFGHSHVQIRREFNGRLFVNPGGLGQPRCGHPLAGYAVLHDGTFEMRSVPYDVAKTMRAMDTVPLDWEYVEAWKEGYRTGTLPARYQLRDFASLMAIAKL